MVWCLGVGGTIIGRIEHYRDQRVHGWTLCGKLHFTDRCRSPSNVPSSHLRRLGEWVRVEWHCVPSSVPCGHSAVPPTATVLHALPSLSPPLPLSSHHITHPSRPVASVGPSASSCVSLCRVTQISIVVGWVVRKMAHCRGHLLCASDFATGPHGLARPVPSERSPVL